MTAAGTGGALDLARFAKTGLFLSSGTGGPLPPGVGGRKGKRVYRPPHPNATLAGLVPDGVATLTLDLPRRIRSYGHFGPTVVYPSAYTTTASVRSNMVFFSRIPRDAVDVRGRIIWRNSRGRVLRVIDTQNRGAA